MTGFEPNGPTLSIKRKWGFQMVPAPVWMTATLIQLAIIAKCWQNLNPAFKEPLVSMVEAAKEH